MRAFIVDDEPLARIELKRLLQQFPEVTVCGEAANVDEAVESINDLRPDILFLDIHLPGRNGFELLEALDQVPTVIFTTAYNEYALKAFEVSALDYLLKPVDPKRLAAAIRKVMELRGRQKSTDESTRLNQIDQIFLRDGERCWFVKVQNIRLLESEGNYSKLYFDTYKPLILRSLNYLEERLDPKMFFRTSRKQIINLKWVESIETGYDGRLIVQITGSPKIEMSRRQSKRFKEQMSM